MKRLFVAAILAVSAPAHAGTPVESTLRGYINWIVANTQYQHPGDALPNVVYLSQSRIKEFVRKGPYHENQYHWGTYDHATNTLIFADDLDITDLEASGTVIHELVHWLQDLRGRFDGDYCAGELEIAPYLIESKWLDHIGSDAERVEPLVLASAAAACRG